MNFAALLQKAAEILWGPATILILFACGLYFTIRTRFFQFRYFGKILSSTFGSMRKAGRSSAGISPFSAVATALSGAIGVGNIVGVALAISAGGAGACFWMWISALFGMMTKFSEIFLAMKYRSRTSNGYSGSAVSFLLKGVKSPLLANTYALLGLLTAFGLGCSVQANALTDSVSSEFPIPKIAVAVAAALLTAILLWGGIRYIAAFSAALIPVVSILYIACTLAIICVNIGQLPSVFCRIFTEAFTPRAVAGGGVFAAIRYGFARGVFSNEAGLGTSAAAHCASAETDPAVQGLWGIIEVFIDTIVICSFSAFAILSAGTQTVSQAAEQVFGHIGPILITAALSFFALSTIIAWSFYGSIFYSFLFHTNRLNLYRTLFCMAVALGGVFSSALVWHAADIFNALIILPNIIGLLILSPEVFTGVNRFVASRFQTPPKKEARRRFL